MNIYMTVCDKCLLEEIFKDIPDYKAEPWGKMPIWAEYRKKSKLKLCVVTDDESVCFEHLFKDYNERTE